VAALSALPKDQRVRRERKISWKNSLRQKLNIIIKFKLKIFKSEKIKKKKWLIEGGMSINGSQASQKPNKKENTTEAHVVSIFSGMTKKKNTRSRTGVIESSRANYSFGDIDCVARVQKDPSL
jgi:hypothetical protein